jgi:pimeloyl-ACP methyl ester carboxylesterase
MLGPVAAALAAATLGADHMGNRIAESFVFQPSPGIDIRPSDVGVDGEEVYLCTEDGVRIHAFWIESPGATRALLFLHGNAGNASHRLPNAARLARLDIRVLLLDYRGYGMSEGRPDEAGVYADARAGLDHLVTERGFPIGRIVVFGRSIGSAVAVDLARGRDLAGVILESPFTSMGEVARGALGPPAAWAVGDMFDSASKIDQLRTPLLFFHGDRDDIVSIELGRSLYERAPEPKSFEVIEGAGHNDTVEIGGEAYFERIRHFLDDVAPPGG